MSDARNVLAGIVAKAKNYVDGQRKLNPTARVRSETPMKSSASVKEAELLKSLERLPAFVPAVAREVKVVFVSESAIGDDSGPGKLLAKIIQAMGLGRADAALCLLSELDLKLPLLKPKALVALGEAAARVLLKSELELGKLRGRFATHGGLPLMPTHHPSELMANEMLKRHVWEDMKLVAAKIKV